MSKGGKRQGAGRKKVGIAVNTRIEIDILEKIEMQFEGKSRAEKIRNCLRKGLENNYGKNSV
jgi:hypothetical protein